MAPTWPARHRASDLSPLLSTKLFIPPARPLERVVARPRLMQRLGEGLRMGHRLTLLSAPAGSGKTTLLSEWATQIRDQTAWLSLDEADNDPVRFWTYLIAALQTVHSDLGQDALQLLQPPRPAAAAGAPALSLSAASQIAASGIQSLLTPLLNQVAALSDRLVLVLDDYHVISVQPIHAGIAFLLDHQPEQLHLVLSTRADPPLPIVRLRARRQLTELRATDLRFTTDEVLAFLNEMMGLDLAADDVAALEARTEGWIVGLQLAALSLQGRADAHEFITAFSGGHYYILDYLTEEVLRRQPRPVQEFLLQTSVLDRLSGPLCDAVTGTGDGDAMLAHLQRGNLFIIPLDDERRWYRYHHLFADLLANQLQRDESSDLIAELHCRASVWYEANGMVLDAMNHALTARDFERAANLIEQNLATMTSSGELTAIFAWINALPEELVLRRPLLCVTQAWASIFAGQLESVGPLLLAAEQHVRSAGEERAIESQSILGNVATARAFVADRSGDPTHATEHAQTADELLPETDLSARSLVAYILGRAYRARGDLHKARRAAEEMMRIGRAAGNVLTTVMAICEQATLRKIQGRLCQSADLYREAAQLATERGDRNPVLLSLIDVGLGDLLLERNDLQAVWQRVQPVVDRLESMSWGGTPTDLVLAFATLARLRLAQGDLEGATDALQRAERARQRFNDFPGFRGVINSCQVRLWLAQGNLAAADRWAASREDRRIAGEGGNGFALIADEVKQITLARVFIAQASSQAFIANAASNGHARRDRDDPSGCPLQEALRLLSRLGEAAEAGGRGGRLIEILALQSVALQIGNETSKALVTLERALSLAEPEGYVRVFLDAGRPTIDLLRLAMSRGILSEYVSKLLTEFDDATKHESHARPQVQIGRKTEEDPSPPIVRRSSLLHPSTLAEPLSQRELDVLQLICAGYSNRGIADRLVVTLNTVKKHSSNIYGKLGVSSRTQAAVRARELGLFD